MPRATNNGAPRQGALRPGCPRCGGPMWDNRSTKRSPKAPDFRCRDRDCGGVIWPGGRGVAQQVFALTEPREGAQPAPIAAILRQQDRSSLRKRYLEVTDFVLSEVRAKYQAAGMACADATLAAIAATLFIAACGPNGRRGGP